MLSLVTLINVERENQDEGSSRGTYAVNGKKGISSRQREKEAAFHRDNDETSATENIHKGNKYCCAIN